MDSVSSVAMTKVMTPFFDARYLGMDSMEGPAVSEKFLMIDGNEAAAMVAHSVSEVVCIYPITPASTMGELADAWSSSNRKNIWGHVPAVVEMQSEGGAAGAVHGSIQTGSLTTTFTASQGLLLMIPNMYKIAGELTPLVIHVAARSLATQALSIFGDHSDVMAARSSGFAMLASGSVQECMDLALVAHNATLVSQIPFIHFFDGFRTSHEIQKVVAVPDEVIRIMIPSDAVTRFRGRALSPDRPFIRGTAMNPDVYFQARESCNPFYDACPLIVESAMREFQSLTGRTYNLFDYEGSPDADRLIVLMGSGAETVSETLRHVLSQGEKVGVLRVRLYRPFSASHLIQAIPPSVRRIAVLDRTKEPGCVGEPLYQDVLTALAEHGALGDRVVIGGRYGLSSKEFTPAMAKAVYDELRKKDPKNHFAVGIRDDVTHRSLDFDSGWTVEKQEAFRGIFYGLGADGTVSANKNSIKIIGEETDFHAQGYFVYDSKKSGSMTTSHLRFGRHPIQSPYLIERANFVAVHQFGFLAHFDVLEKAEPNAVFLLNAPYSSDTIWNHLPKKIQKVILEKKLALYVIDAYAVAQEAGMGRQINTIMQTCFFAISNILPRDESIRLIKDAIQKTYGRKGGEVVERNFMAVDRTLAHLHEVKNIPSKADGWELSPPVPNEAPDFVRRVLAEIIAGRGDQIPVSEMPVDGTYPSGTAKWEKRDISQTIPAWDKDVCIQCGKCALVCPHAVIRIKAFDRDCLKDAPADFQLTSVRGKEWPEGTLYSIQVSPRDCTGCELCVEACPAKNKSVTGRKALNMTEKEPVLEREVANWNYFVQLPEFDRATLAFSSVKGSQFLQPLFEFSGACAGCGETPYLKLATQLFGDRMIVANATGCSSIYGANLPTTPWSPNREGRGPAWSNSLFEDNAEFGLGFRLSLDQKQSQAKEMIREMAGDLGDPLVSDLLSADQSSEAGIRQQRERVRELKQKLIALGSDQAVRLLGLADDLVRRSVWIIGGDGWAYDIGYGGLDHVLASGHDVNILVLDTEVYSNTGGQMSKSTPLGAVAKFAAGGKATAKKDLAFQALSYGNVYVARVAMGANDSQTVKAFVEAEAYHGPSLLLAFSHCIAHGYNLKYGLRQQKLAVESGYWPLFRYHPEAAQRGENPFQLDSKEPKLPLADYAYNETRFKMLTKANPKVARELLTRAQADIRIRWQMLEKLHLLWSNNEPKE